MSFDLKWHGDVPSDDIVAKVRGELQALLDGALKSPAHLILHTVDLSGDMDGPCVTVSGDDLGFLCEYHQEDGWLTIDHNIVGSGLPADERDEMRAKMGLPPIGGGRA